MIRQYFLYYLIIFNIKRNMNIIKPEVKEIIQEKGIDGMLKAVMIAAFVSYQTQKSKLTPKEFVKNVLLKLGHTRPLEFGTVYLIIPSNYDMFEFFVNNPYSKVNYVDNKFYITTNFRVIMQGDYGNDKKAFDNGYDKNWLWVIEKFWSEPTEYHYKRHCFSFIMSRGCSDDLRTHISLSSICESTRYCIYTNNKFGNQMTFIEPYFLDEYSSYMESRDNKPVTPEEALTSNNKNDVIYGGLQYLEELYKHYMSLPDVCAQEGKRIIPLDVKVELMLCGFEDAWDNFLWRRDDAHADPECQVVAKEIRNLLKK